MPVIRTLATNHFALYQTALALLATTVLIHLFSDYGWLPCIGYSTLMVGGFWLSQGSVTLINRALGFHKSRSGSLD